MIVALVALCLAEDAGAGAPAPEKGAGQAGSEGTEKSSNEGGVATAPSAGGGAGSSAAPAPAPEAAAGPPAPAPEAPVAPAAVADGDLDVEPDAVPARVSELSLLRVSDGDRWAIQDGRSRTVDARTWAILTGDSALLDRIATTRKQGRTLGWGLVAGGGAVALSSAIPLFTLEEALAANESTPGFDELGSRNDARVAAAFSLIGTGVILAGTGLVSHAIADKRALDVSRYLDAEAAEASIRAYNRRLEETLAPVRAEAAPSSDVPEELLELAPAQ